MLLESNRFLAFVVSLGSLLSFESFLYYGCIRIVCRFLIASFRSLWSLRFLLCWSFQSFGSLVSCGPFTIWFFEALFESSGYFVALFGSSEYLLAVVY